MRIVNQAFQVKEMPWNREMLKEGQGGWTSGTSNYNWESVIKDKVREAEGNRLHKNLGVIESNIIFILKIMWIHSSFVSMGLTRAYIWIDSMASVVGNICQYLSRIKSHLTNCYRRPFERQWFPI